MSEYKVAQLDTELLIKEVQARPCLYAKKEARYNDVNYKRIVWEKVTKALFPKVWPKYDDEEKGEKVDMVQKRWKNLRACFSRELKRQKDPKWVFGVASKRRKYFYFDSLSFLNDESDKVEEDTTQEIDLPDKNMDDDTILTAATDIDEIPIPQAMPVPKPTVETDNKHTNIQIITNIQNTTIEDSTKEVVTKPPTNTDTNTNISKADLDSTNFALSLVPKLNMIPIPKRVETEIEMLSVLYGFLRKGSNYNKPLKTYDSCEKMIGSNSEIYEAETAEELQIYNSENTQVTQAYETEKTEKTQIYDTDKTEKTQTYETDKIEVIQIYDTEKTEKTQTYDTNKIEKTQNYEEDKIEVFQIYDPEGSQVTQAYETDKTEETQTYESDNIEVIQIYDTEKTEKTQTYDTDKIEKTQTYEEDKIEVFQIYDPEGTQVTQAYETDKTEETQTYESDNIEVIQIYDTEKTEKTQTYDTENIEVIQIYDTEKTEETQANEKETTEETQIVYIEILSDNEIDSDSIL